MSNYLRRGKFVRSLHIRKLDKNTKVKLMVFTDDIPSTKILEKDITLRDTKKLTGYIQIHRRLSSENSNEMFDQGYTVLAKKVYPQQLDCLGIRLSDEQLNNCESECSDKVWLQIGYME